MKLDTNRLLGFRLVRSAAQRQVVGAKIGETKPRQVMGAKIGAGKNECTISGALAPSR